MKNNNYLRTWVEIDTAALRKNFLEMRRIVSPRCRIMAVVKSNAYGHGLVPVAKSLLAFRSFREEGWFGVDSLVEGLRLRREGIQNPIFVLGATFPAGFSDAAEHDIT